MTRKMTREMTREMTRKPQRTTRAGRGTGLTIGVGIIAIAWIGTIGLSTVQRVGIERTDAQVTEGKEIPEKSAIEEEYGADVSRIFTETLTAKQTYAKLRDLCRTAPHRLSGSPGAAAAVEWARQRMVAEGLENVRLEKVRVPHWERGDIGELRFAAPVEAAHEPLPILALGGSEPTPPEGITAEVLLVRSFDELRERREEAVGKIVVFDYPLKENLSSTFAAYGDAVGYRSRGAAEAAKAGAVAAIVRSMTTRLDDFPHTGGMRYQDGIARVPTAAVSTLGAERIARHVDAGKRVVLHFRQNCRWLEDKDSFNVIGELRGREKPEEIVVVGGHLDGWDVGEGAHDDGAGSCQSMDALRTLKKLGLRPRRTLRCVLFMNEENGLAGGRAYYDDHREEMPNHVMALESDRGGFTPRGFTTDANRAAFAILTEIAGLFVQYGADRVERGGGGADISFLRQAGVPLVGYRPDPQRYFDLHHSERDTFDQVNERELELGTAAIAAMIYIVADLEETLPRNTPPKN